MEMNTVLDVDRDAHYVLVDTVMLIQLTEGLEKQIKSYKKDLKKVLRYEEDELTYNDVSKLLDPNFVPTSLGNKPFDAQEDVEFLSVEIKRMSELRDQMKGRYT
jgi:hypothetical protein